jgi:hypothetical protein
MSFSNVPETAMQDKALEIIHLVQQAFREHSPAGFKARVQKAQHKIDEHNPRGWWLVKVDIDIPPDQLFRYYELLSEVEDKLLKKHHTNTLIVPTIPEEQAA